MGADFTKLKRKRHPMPGFVKQALEKGDLMKLYKERPAYQQNDYIGWISQAKMESTKQNRLDQMLSELRRGGVYMKMVHPASANSKSND
ncbi:MAG: YdeI/OmpD-associated family protein [Gammaproteobacteria bacterium]|nr:YdeI/OmpD-associated family protein [Gammaproteobacteria bacterium]NND40106.1 YdeI/OmpD-associated family protein [Pseudomonadales bacterium]NNM12411.1 YdeI/OmpD-associated family protein [Pseudomonadales bacterium]RZV56083.1 MAG: hypothetical protein EX270_05860 [Pseudomonadales bacterium]